MIKYIKKNHLILVLKVFIVTIAFFLVFKNADIAKISSYVKNADILLLAIAYIFLFLAQIISSYRMRFYFSSEGVKLNPRFSIGLYFTSMLYNNILPGGIGGDAYKVYLVSKLANFPKLKSLRLLLSDRASGLFVLLLLAAAAAYFTNLSEIISYFNVLLLLAVIALVPCYLISIHSILKEQPKTALQASIYSFFIQILNVAIIVAIAASFDFDIFTPQISNYILLFLVASVISIIPISIGGVGLRELTFLYGANLLSSDSELGIAIAMVFFVINIICSLNGLIFWNKLEKVYS